MFSIFLLIVFSSLSLISTIQNYLRSSQLPSGEFPSLEYYEPERGNEWYADVPSPFIHANVLLSLLSAGWDREDEVIQKSLHFIKSQREEPGIWRYWPFGTGKGFVPADNDDLSLCSHLLGFEGSRDLMLGSIKKDGYVYTWVLPRLSFLSNFRRYGLLYKEHKISQILLKKLDPHVHGDHETGVTANTYLCLGSGQETKAGIKAFVEKIKSGEQIFEYYSNSLVVDYFVIRAYTAGVAELSETFPTIINRVLAKQKGDGTFGTPMEDALALNILLVTDGLPKGKLKPVVDRLSQIAEQNAWLPEVFYHGKKRDRCWGSPALVAAFALEGLVRMETNKSSA